MNWCPLDHLLILFGSPKFFVQGSSVGRDWSSIASSRMVGVAEIRFAVPVDSACTYMYTSIRLMLHVVRYTVEALYNGHHQYSKVMV